MLETENLIGILVKIIFVLLAGGYGVVGLMIYRQVTILCRILETDLTPLLKLSAVAHLALIVIAAIIVFSLI